MTISAPGRSLLRPARLLLVSAGLCLATATADARPQRIVSLNVCTDQLLLLLADRGQIAALTQFADNPQHSNYADRAKGLRQTRGEAELVLTLKPDLVVAGPYSPASTIALLRRLGFRVEILPLATSLEQIRRNLRTIGRLVGYPARAAKVIADFDARLRRVAATLPDYADDSGSGNGGRRPTVAFYWLGGYSTGSNTLVGDVARAAKFRNLTDRLGVRDVGALALEQLVAGRPDALVLGVSEQDAPSLAREVLRHPALRRLTRRRPHVVVGSRLWVCGTPATAGAVERLAALHHAVLEQRRAAPPGQ